MTKSLMTSLDTLTINSDRLRSDFDELAEIGKTRGGGISRLALSTADIEARSWFADRIEEAGLFLRDDDVGNVSGVLFSGKKNARTLLVGSHLDSVPNGGRYDGAVGVLAGLEVLRVVKEAGLELPVHLEVIDFTDEEGTWQSLFGSMGLTGQLGAVHFSDSIDDRGPFRAALKRAGIHPNDYLKARRDPDSIAAYLELHIEQGRKLYDANIDIGVVTRIIGRTTYQLTFLGEAGHSGTTRPENRRDALKGASDFILQAFDLVESEFPEGTFNCGNVNVLPGAYNIIPRETRLLIECRHPDKTRLRDLEAAMIRLAQECASKHNLQLKTHHLVHMPAAEMDDSIIHTIQSVCDKLHYSHMPIISYAGHDAQMMSTIAPSGMIFIPVVEGISHNPKEYAEWEDIVKGANVLLHTVLAIALREGTPEQISYKRS